MHLLDYSFLELINIQDNFLILKIIERICLSLQILKENLKYFARLNFQFGYLCISKLFCLFNLRDHVCYFNHLLSALRYLNYILVKTIFLYTHLIQELTLYLHEE